VSDTPVEPNEQEYQTLASAMAEVVIDGSVRSVFASGVPIGKKEAVDLLKQRFDAPKVPSWVRKSTTSMTMMYEAMYEALPEEMRTKEVMTNIDIRPYLDAVNGKDIYVGGTGNLQMRQPVDVSFELEALNKQLRDAFDASLPTSMSPGQRQTELDKLLTYEPGVAGVDPRNSQAGQSVMSGAGISGDFDPTAATGGTANLFPVDEMRAMVQAGNMTIEGVGQDEQDAGMGAMLPIDVHSRGGGEGRTGYPSPTKSMSATEAMSFLATLKPSELTNLQKRMAAAGYYDRIGAGTYIEGEFSDANTLAAWKQVLTDAVAKNRSVPQLIEDGMAGYREQVRSARLKDLQQMDPNFARFAANDYARSVIGRDLTSEEEVGLRGYLAGLRRERAGYIGGTSNFGVDGPLANGDQGYTESDVYAYVAKETSTEASTLQQSRQMDVLRKALN